MLGFITDRIHNYRLKQQLDSAQIKLETQVLENFFHNQGLLNNQYVDTDRSLSAVYDKFQHENKHLSTITVDLFDAINQSRSLVQNNAHAKNILNQIINFTVGAGFSIKFKNEDRASNWKNNIRPKIRWAKRAREIVRRVFRDGEAIVRKFEGGEIRFVEPDEITGNDKEKHIVNGVQIEPGDAETITNYIINDKPVPAEEIFHFKSPDTDLNERRGWPVMYEAQQVIKSYENWIKDRALLNRFRASIMMIRKHKNQTSTQLQAFQNKIKSGTFTKGDGKEQKFGTFKPGTILDASSNIDYEFLEPNVGGADVESDGRALRLLIACFFSMPEYMVTSDASNANFSTTSVSEAPGIKAMQSWQEFFRDELVLFLQWLLEEEDQEPVITFPSLVLRKETEEANARMIRHTHGVLSRETWMESDHLDPEEEKKRIDSEPPPIQAQNNEPKNSANGSDKSGANDQKGKI